MASGSATCVLEIRSSLGEGPLWQAAERRLYWVDLPRPAVYRFDPAKSRNEQLRAEIGSYVGGLVFRERGGWIVVKEDGSSAVDAVGGRCQVLLHPEADLPGNWFNDCKCDRQGRLWTGSADRGEKEATGNLYVIGARLGVRKVDSGIIADSYVCRIFRYDIDPETGAVGPRRAFATEPDEAGFPDGMTVDAEGFLWNAHWDGWRVTRYAPDGRIDRVIKLPVPRPTAPAFGGEDLKTLYITSASRGLSESQLQEAPLSGRLFACEPGVRGLPEPSFAG